MATEYLNPGAESLSSGNWDGSGIADSNDFIVNAFVNALSDLDHSGLTTGVESFYIKDDAHGIIGGAGTFLELDCDASADAYLANYGRVTLYFRDGGDAINNFSCGNGSTNYAVGGSIGDIVVDGGFFNANESTEITGDVFINGGIVNIEYEGTDTDLVEVNGGTVTLKRAPTVLTINAGVVILEPDAAEGFSGKTLNLKGGKLILKAGSYPTANLDGGTLDLSQNKRALTLGATAGKSSRNCRIIRHPNANISNITPRGSSKVEVGGGPIPV